jgi:hypothetical protein
VKEESGWGDIWRFEVGMGRCWVGERAKATGGTHEAEGLEGSVMSRKRK